MSDERTRRALAEVEEQRDDAVLYLSTIKLVLGVLARGHGLRVCGQEIAEVLVRQLAVETGAIVLADGAGGELALAGFATQSQRLGGSAGDLDERGWLMLARLVGPAVQPVCFRRVTDGGFVAVAPAELADEGFLVLPFTLGGDPGGAGILHSITAPTQAFARSHAPLARGRAGGPVSDERSSFRGRVRSSTRHLSTLIDDIPFLVQLEADRVRVRSDRARTERLLEQVLALMPRPPGPEQVQVRID